jgi:outer membrane protein TolC
VLTTTLDPNAVRAMVPMMASLVDSISGLPDRPSLRSAELNTKARREGLRIARADFLPSLTLNFNTGYQAFPPLKFGFPDRFGRTAAEFCQDENPTGRVCQNGGWFEDRSIGATLSFPVFDGFRARSNLELARAQLRIADLQLQQERETVALEVARARAELRRARSLFEARGQNSVEAQEAFQLASLRFTRGLSTQLEVSDAQLALLAAQSGEAQATYDLYLASAELARALGQPIPFPPAGREPAVRRSENGTQR